MPVILKPFLETAVPGADLLAYGPAPGLELIPYFLALLAWMGLALLAVLLSPFRALLRRLRGTGSGPQSRNASKQAPVSQPETGHEGRPNEN
jgi:hypothetical protein